MFQKGDKVYHRTLKWYGIFQKYDWASDSEAVIIFTDDEGYEDERVVTVSLLNKVED